MAETTDPKRNRSWVKIILGVSLALNLLIVGLIAGAMLGGPHDRDRDRNRELRDLGYGPFVAALPRAERRVISEAIKREAGAFRENRDQMRAMFEAFLTALRADPYDPEALRAIVDEQQSKVTERQNLGRGLLWERIEAMDAAERAAYADALDRALRRGPRRGWRHEKGRD